MKFQKNLIINKFFSAYLLPVIPTGFFCAVKVLATKDFAKERKFSKTLLGLRSLGEGVSDCPWTKDNDLLFRKLQKVRLICQ